MKIKSAIGAVAVLVMAFQASAQQAEDEDVSTPTGLSQSAPGPSTNKPPQTSTALQSVAAKTNDLVLLVEDDKQIIKVTFDKQIVVGGVLIGRIVEGKFVPVEQSPGFGDGIVYGATVARRNPDVADIAVLKRIAEGLYQRDFALVHNNAQPIAPRSARQPNR